MLSPFISIPVQTESNDTISFKLFSESEDENSLVEIEASDAEDNCEAQVQLLEGFSYEYELPQGFSLQEIEGIVRPSKRNSSSGRIVPGIYVGTLSLKIIESHINKEYPISLEIRSIKTSYREDYRFMLEEITKACTDLLLQHSSPVVQNYTIDYDKQSKTIYQRFTFIKSIIESEDFNQAIHRIISSPVTGWESVSEETDFRKVRHIDNSHIKQISSRSDRIKIPIEHSLSNFLVSLPSRLIVRSKSETLDVPENRFIKHMLSVFFQFCSKVKNILSEHSEQNKRLYHEAQQLEEKLNDLLSQSIFKQISSPSSLPLNSPVLQRREGYREMLHIWLMFDLAAKLIWKGGEDVYKAGKKDVAVLYEYWLFFKLLEIIGEVFSIEPKSLENLIEPTNDGLGLKLKYGKHIPIKGIYYKAGRKLNVEFSYNRTFSGNGNYPASDYPASNYPEKGSWTMHMRPDYTLSIWPAEFSQEDAEKQELITHIHFDAKYKVNFLGDIIGEDKESLDEEKNQQKQSVYKRADLLKMHAYKDAIRRTSGAYILYPGDKNAYMRGFHEIIPGLGAFTIRPSSTDDGTQKFKIFIKKVTEHLLNRATQRERLSYRIYEIHKRRSDTLILEPIPELFIKERAKPPEDSFVLVGYYKDIDHYQWIEKNGLYNVRINRDRGSINLDPETVGANYLLLHSGGELISSNIRKIIGNGPRIFSKAEMIENGYNNPNSEFYLVFTVEKISTDEFAKSSWDIRKLRKYETGRLSAFPFSVSLIELMKAKVRDNQF